MSIITRGLSTSLLITRGYGTLVIVVEETPSGGNFKKKRRLKQNIYKIDYRLRGIKSSTAEELLEILGIKQIKTLGELLLIGTKQSGLEAEIASLLGLKRLKYDFNIDITGIKQEKLEKLLKLLGIVASYITKEHKLYADLLYQLKLETAALGTKKSKTKRKLDIVGSKEDLLIKKGSLKGKLSFKEILLSLMNIDDE